MTTIKPADLTEPQWLLLRHLHKCKAPFYTDFLYEQFSKHQIDRLYYYRMFFRLITYSYIEPDGYEGQQLLGWKQDFRYIVSVKGKRTVSQYTQVDAEESIYQLPPKRQAKGIIAAFLARTVQLKDYSFDQ